MIVTRTPFRITLGGGGTDLPSFYEQHGGFIFAMGIDKYMYIMLNPPTVDDRIRLHYSRSETVDHVDELQHELAREALRLHGIHRKMELSSMADLPDGTGLGSSGAYLVGLLTALHQYRRDHVSLQSIAEEACHIELNVLGRPVGKQDQYMAAFGGLTVLDIDRTGNVTVRPIAVSSGSLSAFVANTHLYYTGVRRSAMDVLRDQDSALRHRRSCGDTGHGEAAAERCRAGQGGGAADRPAGDASSDVQDALLRIKDLGHRILDSVVREEYDEWGSLLHEHWCSKRRLSTRVSPDGIDLLYERVRSEYGVLGGKIAGAGGGGFLMLYCPRDHRRLEQFMLTRGMPRLHYTVEPEGTKVVANLKSAAMVPPLATAAAIAPEAISAWP
jgi:D-glycero-alpha-D-manno-heptose-7-phosphate kinase